MNNVYILFLYSSVREYEVFFLSLKSNFGFTQLHVQRCEGFFGLVPKIAVAMTSGCKQSGVLLNIDARCSLEKNSFEEANVWEMCLLIVCYHV